MAGGKRVEQTEVMSGDDIGKALRVGRYKVEKKIGQGGMADIFLARADGPGGFEKQVVIKKIRAQLGRNHKFVEMFLREARLLATLDHPNIVRIIELGEQEGEYFLALEYLEGLPLRDVVERYWYAKRSLPLETLLRCMADSARGLEHAHAFKDSRGHPANLVHRDVSPDNLFMTTSGTTKVLDFGIAKREGIDMLTQAGEIKGKIPFMSPEALQGYPLDRRCDIWSMGVILYWMCTGKRPFDGASDLHTMKAVLEDEAQPVRDLNPKVPKAVDDVIRACLQKDRDKRTKTAGALADALGKIVAQASGVPSSQILVSEALRMDGVEWEVRPKHAAVVPAAEWAGPTADPTTAPPEMPEASLDGTFVAEVPAGLAKELARAAPKEAAPKEGAAKDAAHKEASKAAKSPKSKSGSSKRGRGGGAQIAASPNARVRALDAESGDGKPPSEGVAGARPDSAPKRSDAAKPAVRVIDPKKDARSAPPGPKDPSWEGPSMPRLDVERVPASEFNVDTDENERAAPDDDARRAPGARGTPARPTPPGPAPLFEGPSSGESVGRAQASSGPVAALLGVVVALVVVSVAVVALGLQRDLLARMGFGASAATDGGVLDGVADAGDPGAAADSGALVGGAARSDAGVAQQGDTPVHFEEIDAGIALPSKDEVLRVVELVAPDHVEWRTQNGESLFTGSAETRVSLAEETLLALDTKRGCTARVLIKGKRKVDYAALPRGRLMVKGKKNTDILLGSDKIAELPMKNPVELIAGSCELRAKLRGDEQKQPIEIKAGRLSTVALR